MKATEIKRVAEREPFRPFAIRLSNGAQYVFKQPRDFGAPKSFNMIFFFGKDEAVRIDPDSITEVLERL